MTAVERAERAVVIAAEYWNNAHWPCEQMTQTERHLSDAVDRLLAARKAAKAKARRRRK